MAHAVRFEEVTKRYPRGWTDGEEPRYASLRHDVASLGRRLGSRVSGRSSRETGTLALKKVSFEIEEGESFAIIGPNGAGKSTALKLISRISYPTSGRISIRGRVAALMEVGSGVHPELTGRENIWLYGQILGMTKADIRRRFDEIVEFSELGGAIDTPVKFFSSGMQLRLGFSIAVHLEPDIFLVDEALAVGDAGFQARCVERMAKLVAEGHTLLFVSHSLLVVESICERALFLRGGRLVSEGESGRVVREYLSWVDQRRLGTSDPGADEAQFRSAADVRLNSVTLHAADGGERYTFAHAEDVEVRLHLSLDRPLTEPLVTLGITDGRPGALALASMQVDGNVPDELDGDCAVTCRFRSPPLLPGVYEVVGSIVSGEGWGEIVEWQTLAFFRVTEIDDGRFQGRAVASHLAFAPVLIDYRWAWGPEDG